AATAPERELAVSLALPYQVLDRDGAIALEPALAPVFRRGILWSEAASITNPLAVTRAYAKRLTAFGGIVLKGDARTLHRNGVQWRAGNPQGPVGAARGGVGLRARAPRTVEALPHRRSPRR